MCWKRVSVQFELETRIWCFRDVQNLTNAQRTTPLWQQELAVRHTGQYWREIVQPRHGDRITACSRPLPIYVAQKHPAARAGDKFECEWVRHPVCHMRLGCILNRSQAFIQPNARNVRSERKKNTQRTEMQRPKRENRSGSWVSYVGCVSSVVLRALR